MEISVVIPALNEADNLRVLLPKIREVLARFEFEIIVVDGNSRDGTREVASALGSRVVEQKQPGFGGALRDGFAAASGEYVIQMDADMQHDPAFISKLLGQKEMADMVVASRYVKGGSMNAPFTRRILSRLLNKFTSLYLRVPVNDTSSGFRLYRRAALQSIETSSIQLEIEQEIVTKLYDKGFRIVEVPIHINPREGGESKVSLIKYGLLILSRLSNLNKLRRAKNL